MDKEKQFDGFMKFVAAAYLLILFGFIKIVAAAYLLVLIGWLAREMYINYKIGQEERKEYKAREQAWKKDPLPKTVNKGSTLDLAEAASD